MPKLTPVLLVLFVGYLVVMYGLNLSMSISTARSPGYEPTNAWLEALAWLKENTPPPFPDGDVYYEQLVYPSNIPPLAPRYIASYSVLAWWDYGYWITRIAHRVPVANPSQAVEPTTQVARLLLSQNEVEIERLVQDLKIRYIIIDYPTVLGKFPGITAWAGEDIAEFYTLPGGQVCFRPRYYQSFVVRLYNFDGKDVEPSFPTAQSPVLPSVAIESLPSFRLVFASGDRIALAGGNSISEVKIFEYLGGY